MPGAPSLLESYMQTQIPVGGEGRARTWGLSAFWIPYLGGLQGKEALTVRPYLPTQMKKERTPCILVFRIFPPGRTTEIK